MKDHLKILKRKQRWIQWIVCVRAGFQISVPFVHHLSLDKVQSLFKLS